MARYPKYSLLRRRLVLGRSWPLVGRLLRPNAAETVLTRTNVPQRYAMALTPTPPAPELLEPRFYLTDAETEAAAALLKRAEPNRPLVLLHPHATHATKRWPMERWPELIARLSAAGMDWRILGGPGEQPLAPQDPRDLTGTTSLRELLAVLARGDALVTNDSGPLHLARGVGTPVVALFGPTHPGFGFAPPPPHRLLQAAPPCRPCSLHGKSSCSKMVRCWDAASPDDVLAALRAVLPG